MSGDQFEFDDSAHVGRLTGTLHDPGATVGQVLTVQADKSIKAAAGGGSQPVRRVQVTLDAATVGQLATTPHKIASTDTGSVLIPLIVSASYLFGTTPYDSTGDDLGLLLGTGTGVFNLWLGMRMDGFLDQPNDQNYAGFGMRNFMFGGPDNIFSLDPPDGNSWEEHGGDLWLTADVDPTSGDGSLYLDILYMPSRLVP